MSGIRTYSSGSKDILCEDDALRLDNKEVNELVNITQDGIEALLGKSIVLSWANLGDESVGEQSLSSGLRNNGDSQGHVCKLEGISQDVEVPGSEDEEDDRSIGDSGCSGVVP